MHLRCTLANAETGRELRKRAFSRTTRVSDNSPATLFLRHAKGTPATPTRMRRECTCLVSSNIFEVAPPSPRLPAADEFVVLDEHPVHLQIFRSDPVGKDTHVRQRESEASGSTTCGRG